MIAELCQELRNWFDRGQPHLLGTVRIYGNSITVNGEDISSSLKMGQYFRIVGSVFNDGVYQFPADDLAEETFDGAIWAMAVPPDAVALSNEIDEWNDKYAGVDSAAMSPFNSESFNGYSYSKSTGGSSGGSGNMAPGTWQSAFANRMNKWRKIR